MRWYLAKIQSCTIVLINNFEILQVSIAFFSESVWPRILKFFLYINLYGYSMHTKFHATRSHSYREKWVDNLKLASHSSPILCDRGTWNLFYTLAHMDAVCKPNFMLIGRTVLRNMRWYFENSIARFFNTVQPRDLKFILYFNLYGYSMQTKFHVPRSHSLLENCDDNLQNSKLHNCPNKQLWNITT